jgi:hypothetical protein
MAEELHRLGAIRIPLVLDPTAAVQLVAQLQLARRHPENIGSASELANEIIEKITEFLRATGFVAHAHLADLGAVAPPVCGVCGAKLGPTLEDVAAHRCDPPRTPLFLVRSS